MPDIEHPRLLSFYLSSLRELGTALAHSRHKLEKSRSLRESLLRVMGTFTVGRGALLIWDEDTEKLESVAASGCRPGRQFSFDLHRRDIERLAGHPRPFHPHIAPSGMEDFALLLQTDMDRLNLHLIVPLSTGSTLIGVLLLGHKLSGDPMSRMELEILEEMAGLLALRVEDARARRKLQAQVRQLQRMNRQLRQIYLETVRALAQIIDGPSPGEGPGHSQRVASLGRAIAQRMNLNRERQERIYLAGLLHDIGRHIIDQEILTKKGPLNSEERRKIESSPLVGCELISHLRFPWGDVAEIIRHHRERMDGSGYPDRLKGDEISDEAKILMLAEAFDSMTQDQPWRPRLSLERVVEQIGENLGIQFDPKIVKALCEVVESGLKGEVDEDDFVPQLTSSFDPQLIRRMIVELRKQIDTPTYRKPAVIISMDTPALDKEDLRNR